MNVLKDGSEVYDYLFEDEIVAWDMFRADQGRAPSREHFLFRLAELRAALHKVQPYGRCPLCQREPQRPGDLLHEHECYYETLPSPNRNQHPIWRHFPEFRDVPLGPIAMEYVHGHGPVRSEHIIIWHDGPQYFTFCGHGMQLFTAFPLDETDPPESKTLYLITAVDENYVNRIEAGEVTVREALKGPFDKTWAGVVARGKFLRAYSVATGDLPDSYLPDEGVTAVL